MQLTDHFPGETLRSLNGNQTSTVNRRVNIARTLHLPCRGLGNFMEALQRIRHRKAWDHRLLARAKSINHARNQLRGNQRAGCIMNQDGAVIAQSGRYLGKRLESCRNGSLPGQRGTRNNSHNIAKFGSIKKCLELIKAIWWRCHNRKVNTTGMKVPERMLNQRHSVEVNQSFRAI